MLDYEGDIIIDCNNDLYIKEKNLYRKIGSFKNYAFSLHDGGTYTFIISHYKHLPSEYWPKLIAHALIKLKHLSNDVRPLIHPFYYRIYRENSDSGLFTIRNIGSSMIICTKVIKAILKKTTYYAT